MTQTTSNSDLLTFNQLVELLKANYPADQLSFTTSESGNELVGVMLLPNTFVWHWFASAAGGKIFLFNHSYSQNNGQTYKGAKHSYLVRKSITKKVGQMII